MFKQYYYLILFILINSSHGAWKEEKNHYEFTFEWTKDDWWSKVNFIIPKEEALRSYNEIKTYNGSWSKGYEKVKDQYTKSEKQPKKNEEHVRLYWEKFIAKDAPHLKGLAEALVQTSKDKSQRGVAEHALSFVQSIPYSAKFDNKSGYITPIRVLMDNKGDCDSKSALYAAILDNLNIKWKLLYYPEHVLIGVNVPRYSGDSYLPDNEDYVLAEPAGPYLRRLGSWNYRKGLSEIVEGYQPPNSATPTPETLEKESITKIIEDAKLLVTKRNTALVGKPVTLKSLYTLQGNDRIKVQNKLANGDIVSLGTFPSPFRPLNPTVTWKEIPEETQPTSENSPNVIDKINDN
jgi:hypothetical protein